MNYLDKSALRVVGTRPIRPDGVDKVTGRANFGADMTMPGMLWGRIKRSPHAHARIVSINTEKARALPGVKAVITRADFPDITPERAHIGAAPHNLRDLSLNCMAKGKVLYDGHPVAAVAATSQLIAEQALDLIEVEYEVLPHVMDVEAAMADGRAAPARQYLHRGDRAEAREAVEHHQGRAFRQRRCRGRLQGSRRGHRAALHDKAGAPGLYRAARLSGFGWRRWPDDDLQLEPGPVHGARLHRAHLRRRHRQYSSHPGRDRRRLWRQDDHLPRTARLYAVEEIGAAGQDPDEPRGGIPRHRADLRRRCRSQARRASGTVTSSRRKPSSNSRPGRSPARRCSRAASAPWRSTTFRTH